jgi:predicted MFS family arabinose efflux permease
MGAFSAFLDIAYGLAGPAAGLIAGRFGYAAVYLLGAACALLGAALVVTARSPKPEAGIATDSHTRRML